MLMKILGCISIINSTSNGDQERTGDIKIKIYD